MTNFENIFLEAFNIDEDLTDHDHPYMWEIVDKDSEKMTAYSEYEYDSKKDATDAAMKAFDTKNIDKANSILIVSKKTSDEIPLKEEINLDEAYGEDVYFKAYITNLGAYNEGKLVGKWVEFPIDEDDFQEVLENIGVDGVDYEEWFVSDYDCSLDINVSDQLGEYPSLESLNDMGELIDSIQDPTAVENAYELTDDLEEAIEGINNGDIEFLPDVDTYDELGRYFVDRNYGGDLSNQSAEDLFPFIDFDELGRDISIDFDDSEMGMSVGEFYCGNEDASYTEIGEAAFDEGDYGGSSIESYFDYGKYGQDCDLQVNGMFTKDGYTMEIY